MKNKFWIVDMPKYSMIIFIVLNIIAMLLYPGSNLHNKILIGAENSQVGYSFFDNFFSDLGRYKVYSNESNLVSCLLFNTSLCVVGFCFVMLFYKIKDVFAGRKKLSLFASLLGILSGLSYIGVAFTPADLFLDLNDRPWMHIFFAHRIFEFLSIASILCAILIVKTKNFDNKYAYGFIMNGIMVGVYVLLSQYVFKDPLDNPEFLRPHVIAQKMIAFWILISIYLYSLGLNNYLKEKLTN